MALVAIAVLRGRPRLAIALWICAVAFVPIWLGVSLVVYFQPASLLGFFVLVALLRGRLPRFGFADLIAAFFFVACLAPILSGGATISTLFGVIAVWLLGYLLGRLAPSATSLEWIYTCVAVVFTVVAVLAIVEAVAGWHPFTTWGPSNGLYATWGTIQVRAGLDRAEGAFGHSIALGSSLALAIPLTMAAPIKPWVRLVMVAAMVGAIGVSLSRVSLIAAGLGMLLMVLFVRGAEMRRIRASASALLVLAAIVVIPLIGDVLTTAGDEATRSASYRTALTELIGQMSVLGLSQSSTYSATGVRYFGGFQSIDSQLIFTGLTYGVFALLLGLVLLVVASIAVVTGRATAPTVAVVAQIPVLTTVALITQYAIFFWFVAGLAVAAQVGTGRDGSSRLPLDVTPAEAPPSGASRNSPGLRSLPHQPHSSTSSAQSSTSALVNVSRGRPAGSAVEEG